ncbi:hypothetical protein SD70_17015 [Gordoniibacillus kamchatkensis]|uniref:Uncharacterized protein n=1 Tax=Gordoniibacillus kamchatkensis TaxID=1590651 RepID=A0ABR5AFU7_9BACL|nr:hypothetical protein [Paenibacillus sp. VKM B-2647]KIL39924.1 hypothetical protein SD70_17015 [Paenibacillus sp. VKM B-2647]
MTEVDQHQQPMMHALERAKQAITMAKEARWSLEQAQIVADPGILRRAHDRLQEAEREVADATKQLEHHDTESHHQQIAQTMTQLRAAAQDIDIATQAYTTPKQIR